MFCIYTFSTLGTDQTWFKTNYYSHLVSAHMQFFLHPPPTSPWGVYGPCLREVGCLHARYICQSSGRLLPTEEAKTSLMQSICIYHLLMQTWFQVNVKRVMEYMPRAALRLPSPNHHRNNTLQGTPQNQGKNNCMKASAPYSSTLMEYSWRKNHLRKDRAAVLPGSLIVWLNDCIIAFPMI